MRTTLDLQDGLLAKARRKAVETKTTLTAVVEEALRRYLMPARKTSKKFQLKWVVIHGKRPPSVDIADRDRLYDAMEQRDR